MANQSWPAPCSREWFNRRLLGKAELRGDYVDIGAAASLATIRLRLAGRAIHYGLPDIDASAIRIASPRRFTQEISRLVYECEPDHGEPFAGIRYYSRLDDATVNWAIFEPAGESTWPFRAVGTSHVAPDDPDVQHALATLGLRVEVEP